MDSRLLRTMLKLALDTDQVKPEEVMAILQENRQGLDSNQNTETVDSEVLDTENPSKDDLKNDEGKILESAFKELEVEDAIEEAKDRKKLGPTNVDSQFMQSVNTSVHKVAAWDRLRDKFKKQKFIVCFK